MPGYHFLQGMTSGVGGKEGGPTVTPVLVRIEDAWQIGFLTERIEGGHVAVYVPGCPNPTSGSLYFLTEDRIRPLDLTPREAMKCLTRMGIESDPKLRESLT